MNQSITQLSLSANLASMRALGDHVCMWSTRTATTTQPVGTLFNNQVFNNQVFNNQVFNNQVFNNQMFNSIGFNKLYHQRPKESPL